MTLATTILGTGRAVVLLPWFSLDSAVMALAFEPIFSASGDWRRIYLDLPGTADSAAVEPSSDAVLDAVQETLDGLLGAEPFTLVGCSYGGYLAAGLARRAPDRVQRLALVASGVRIRPEDRDLDGALESEPEDGWLDVLPVDLHDHFRTAVGCQTRDVSSRLARAFEMRGPTDDDYLDKLRSSGFPLSDEQPILQYDGELLMVTGRRDRIAGYRDQLAALDGCPRGSFVALAAAGHYLPFEEPDLLRSIMLSWLRSGR